MNTKKLYLLISFVSITIFLTSFQTSKPKYFDLYLHKVIVLNSEGKKLDKDWKIGINAHNRYTHITVKDTQNIIVDIDKDSELIMFYKGEIKFHLHTSELTLCKKNKTPKELFNVEYEYNLYIQLENNCNWNPSKKRLNGLSFQCRKVENFNFNNSEPTDTAITYLPMCECENKILLFGNLDKKNKLKRNYVRLDSKLY